MEIPNKPNTIAPQEGVKFNEEEMNELNSIRKAYEQITLALGQYQIQRKEIEGNELKTFAELGKTEGKEQAFLQQILAKYGEGTVNQDTGVFTPKKA
jgi:hypothetical protein